MRNPVSIFVRTCRATVFAMGMAVAGCADDEITVPAVQPVSEAPFPQDLYTADVTLGISESIAAAGRTLPLHVYLGLFPQSETRLGAKAAVDLREIQRILPTLLSGKLDPDCGLGLTVGLTSAQAEGDAVRAQGAVRAELYRCKGRGSETETRGAHLWTQVVDFEALVSGGLSGECVGFELRDLSLDPRGLTGGLGTFFGITERVRRAIVTQGNAALQAAPVCPEMPEGLALLSPDFTSGGAIEIGDGGMGAALSGSVASDAERLVALMRLWQDKGALPAAGEGNSGLPAGTVAFRFEDSLKALDPPLSYGLDLRLRALSPTRIAATAGLDLRDVQRRLPDMARGAVLVDDCRARVEVQDIELLAQAENLVALARLDARSYTCERTGDSSWQRGALERAEEVDVRAEISASVTDDCLVFHLVDLARDPPLPVVAEGRQGARSEAARTLFIDAVDHLLQDRPLCPELPAELRVLAPKFRSGAPMEMGSGGLGFGLEGSVELGATTIIAMLQLLQERGVLPPRP